MLANALQVIISLMIGAVFMNLSVQFNSSVTTLILNGCKIGARGGIHVASMLQVTACLGPEDVSLLERCPHFRGWYVQASMELGPEDMSLLESFSFFAAGESKSDPSRTCIHRHRH